MKHIYIENPCSENWNDMLPTQRGAFCLQCSKEVIDFRVLTQNEIKLALQGSRSGEVCGWFHTQQLEKLNAELDAYSFRSTKSFQSALVFSLIVVFGLSLFSCSGEQRQELEQLRSQAKNALKELSLNQLPEVSEKETPEKTSSSVQIRSGRNTSKDGEQMFEVTGGAIVYQDRELHVTEPEEPQLLENKLLPTLILKKEVDTIGTPVPTQIDVLVYPNPTNGPATFKMDLPEKQHFLIRVVNGNGQLIDKLHDGTIDSGTFRQEMDLSAQPPGMYYVTIVSESFQTTLKVSKL